MAPESAISTDSSPKQGVSRDMRVTTPNELAIILVNIDHFGQHKDSDGRQVGNALLKDVADILQATMRATDVPARVERDVFSVLLPGTSARGAVVAAERLRAAISAQLGEHSVSVSVGIANSKRTTWNVEQVMHEAEQALALSKKLGRNYVVHFDQTGGIEGQIHPRTGAET